MGSDVGQIFPTATLHRDHSILYALVCEKEISHMSKNNGNPALVCENVLDFPQRSSLICSYIESNSTLVCSTPLYMVKQHSIKLKIYSSAVHTYFSMTVPGL